MIKDLYDQLPHYLKSDCILFRGFKLEKNNDEYTLQDIRGPYYKDVDEETLEFLESKGLIKGATYLLMESDKRKILLFKEKINEHARLIVENLNPRKKQEYLNSIERFEIEVEYYTSQVRKWQNLN